MCDPKNRDARIGSKMLDYVKATTHHSRKGSLKNGFTYGVDFVVTDFRDAAPWALSVNRFNLWSLWERHHGGTRGVGSGITWFRDALKTRGFPLEGARLVLLTQPSCLGFHFNPVSFWVAMIDDAPCAFVAEVNSTFGQRHCYFCAHPDFRPISKSDRLTARKMMHVSPFQKVEGLYHFNFEMTPQQIDIRINYENGTEGVYATLSGNRRRATSAALVWAAMRRPLGAARVVFLIHWQALILAVKRAPFLKKQAAPEQSMSTSCPKLETNR